MQATKINCTFLHAICHSCFGKCNPASWPRIGSLRTLHAQALSVFYAGNFVTINCNATATLHRCETSCSSHCCAAMCKVEIGITVWSAVETDHQVLLVSPMQPPDKSCWIIVVQCDWSGGRLGLTSCSKT
jgi:hypothetical protein